MKRVLTVIILFICIGNIFAETIILNAPNGDRKDIQVDVFIEKLIIGKEMPVIKSIDGLEKLYNLKSLEISFSDLSMMNSTTWENLRKLEVFKLSFCTVEDFSFLRNLKNLKVFSFSEGMDIRNTAFIDFADNANLYFFEIHTAKIKEFPVFLNIPETLKYVCLTFKVEDDFYINRALKEFKCKEVLFYINKIYLPDIYEKMQLRLITGSEYAKIREQVGV